MSEIELTSKLDWQALKTAFDSGADSSPIRYAASVQKLTQCLLEKLDEYEANKAAVIAEMVKLSPPKEFLPDILRVRAEVEAVLKEAEALRDDLLAADDLAELAALETKPRPSFSLVTEALVEKLRQILLNVEFYEAQPEFVKKACAALDQQFENPAFYYADPIHWDASTKLLLLLIDYVKEGHLCGDSTAANGVLDQLFEYRKALCEIYGKSSTNPKPEEFSARIDHLKTKVQEIISAFADSTERKWLENRMRLLK